MKIVIASDSFKGSLSSSAVAKAASEGILSVMPDAEVIPVSVADGGEGLTETLVRGMGGETVKKVVSGPLFRPCEAFYGRKGNVAIVEAAAASGLTLLNENERNPMKTTTLGTGELIMDAIDGGCREFLAGVGGSATNDAGTGMLIALGWRFLDRDGNELDGTGESLAGIAAIDDSGVDGRLKECSFTVACDVDIPFCGVQGAAHVFGPQKGADTEMVRKLDEGMENFAAAVERKYGVDIRRIKGTGAAGGLGGAFLAFLGATLRSGIETVLDALDFDAILEGADMVITGEGCLDSQTASGKAACGVLKRARRHGIPCVAVGGQVKMCPELEGCGFDGIFAVSDGCSTLQEAMREETAYANVRSAAARIAAMALTKCHWQRV